ncbi:TetR/AcrR family transcriptional regulator [Rothia kristinae]|uniref:TetR/AcrR family transcriptional regulator n=1 Tax=Rothia kristinae TaxID=37923 RepID=UPI000C2644F7|nr:TetR/AcrR family transcriptional regulator C-terminal domain-containing protein [Rothia kristinae]
MTQKPPRRRGRPTRTVLDPARIVATARELLETVGEGFTMTMLARRLGVAPSSLYNHVGSKDEVLARISDDVARGIDASALAGLAAGAGPEAPEVETAASPLADPAARAAAWRDAAEAWARSYFRAFSAQPSMVAALALTPVAQAPQTLQMYETVIRGFLAAGWPEPLVLRVVETLEAFLLGSALDAAAPQDIFAPGALSSRFPVMARVHGLYETTGGPAAATEAFEIGLDGILTGLERRLTRILG